MDLSPCLSAGAGSCSVSATMELVAACLELSLGRGVSGSGLGLSALGISSSSGTLPAHHSIPVRKGTCNTATHTLRINQFCTVLPAYHFGILAALMTGFTGISVHKFDSRLHRVRCTEGALSGTEEDVGWCPIPFNRNAGGLATRS